jgi:hypothetical protein
VCENEENKTGKRSLASHLRVDMLSFLCVLLTVLHPLKTVLSDVVVEIIQPYGQRILTFSEIQLLQGGQQLPDYLATFSFSATTEQHNAAHFCNDADLLTSCQNSLVFNADTRMWEGAEDRPSLYIHLTDAFFDTLVGAVIA